MSQLDEATRNKTFEQVSKINRIEGFDPEALAVEFTDLSTGEKRKRLPVVIQMAWFRLIYPQGKIALQVSGGKDCFIATARIYVNYKDPVECYLAEATASRGVSTTKPSVSPREWAQTAAIGIALRNAGFGLQFTVAGDELEETPSETLNGVNPKKENSSAIIETDSNPEQAADSEKMPEMAPMELPAEDYETVPKELTEGEKLELAMKTPCPIPKLSGKTLGDLIQLDPRALTWVATSYTKDPQIQEAAKLICEYAMQQATA